MKPPKISDNDFENLIYDEIKQISDLQLLILKGHILIEYSLNKFIDDCSDESFNLDLTNFTFSNKVNLAKALGLFWSNRTDFLENHIRIVNKLRNQIAHSLSFEEQTLKEIISFYIQEGKIPNLMYIEKSNFENFYHIIPSICGNIIGRKMSKQKISSFSKAVLSRERNKDPDNFERELTNYKNENISN